MCWSVACDGGESSDCQEAETEGAFRKVVCEPPKPRSPTTKNVVIEHDQTVGVWGGTCECPDGETYLVGARDSLRPP